MSYRIISDISSMRQVDLKGIQQLLLELLKDVHDFCVSHDISYSLAYGTMLGAVRHKGFIPWDDDVDIVMPRPDYERFKSSFQSERGNVLVAEKDSYIAFTRVCDERQTVAGKSLWPWTPNVNLGGWIDIFPLDAIEDDREAFSARMEKLEDLYEKQLKARNALVRPSKEFSFSQNVKQAIKNILFAGLSVKKINSEIIEEIPRLDWATCTKCSQLVCGGDGDKEFFDKELFQETILMPFEKYEFYVAAGWDEILRANYGDYMKLPPVEEREQHTSHTKFYWKES